MARGIMITGPSGSGKSTLGKKVAGMLGFTFIDIDDYIWRTDTPKPFTKMYSRAEKISRLSEAIAECDRFVIAGSMDSFHEHFDDLFELTVLLHADANLRRERVHARELDWFGDRILEGGDMHADHIRYLDDISGYDEGRGGCTLQFHEKWLASLPCPSARLDGAEAIEHNANIIIETYKKAVAH